MIQKIIKVGNELYIPLPAEITQALQLKEGSVVTVSVDPEKKQILIQSLGQSTDLGEINLEFTEQVTAFIRDYKPALDELARLEE
jgi:antitoxin component of MazEF toxin-antitoxin module